MQALVALLVSAVAATAQPNWHNLGPGGGGWIQSVCASPHDAEELFIGCDVGGFYRSADGGQSYTIHNVGLEDYWVECLAPHPTDPNTLYIGCESGVYKSTDRGRSWQWLRAGFPPKARYSWSAPIGALVIDPEAPDTVYAGIGRPRRYEFGKGALYKTTDGGAHWAKVNAEGSLPAEALVSDLLIDPRDSRHLYLACQFGAFQSRDAGVAWELTTAGLPHRHVRRLAQCRAHPDILYLTLESPPGQTPWQGGVYRSTDGGNAWTPCLDGLKQSVGKPGQAAPLTSNYDRIVCHPDNPNVAYVGGTGWVNATLYKTVDGGKTWTDTVRRGDNTNLDMGWITMWGPTVNCLSMSPLNPAVLYFGTSGHVFQTTDGGDHWQQAYTRVLPDGRFQGAGLEVTCLHNIVVHPTDPRRLYFGYYDIGLLRSDDGGDTFRRCTEGIEPRDMQNSCMAVAFDPDDPSHCWSAFGQWGSNQGLVAESTDGGLAWRVTGTPETGLPNARHRVVLVEAASPANARRLLTTADDHGVYVSEDSGASWQARNDGLPHGNIRDLVAHPTQPGAYWCALGDDGKSPGAVFRTDERGKHWTQASRDLQVADVQRLAVAASDPQRLYLAVRDRRMGNTTYPGGVYRSDDGGVTWRRALEDDFVERLAVDPRDANVVYAGLTDHPYHDECTGGGIVMTRDGGATWADLSGSSLTCKQVGVITLDPHDPDRLYLGTHGNGAFVGQMNGR